jgi:Flp pilus assembly protein protease CpaA
MLLCYAQGLMGGGDLKLMSVALLWSGPHCAIPFLILLVLAAFLHGFAANIGWVRAQRANGRIKIAFAPAIAAGMIGIFMLGCLRPM